MRVLILSAYDAKSHHHWHQGLVDNCPTWDFTVLTLPARYFAWRIRGNSMSWAFGEARSTLEKPYDLIIATSMVDLSALKGFVPKIANTPCWVYFHENQFAYPTTEHHHKSVEPQMVTLYSALAADGISFNSEFNRATFLSGVGSLLKKLPDQVPVGLLEHLEARSNVLPVPINNALELTDLDVKAEITQKVDRPLKIVWAARWEYDKGPDRLLAILSTLKNRNVPFRLALLGESFRNSPSEFDEIHTRFRSEIDQFGYAANKAEYHSWLKQADVVLSTATHEFQGVSVLEAVALGCIPVLPNRLVYPELFGKKACYATQINDGITFDQEINAACDRLAELHERINDKDGSPMGISSEFDVTRFYWRSQVENYQAQMQKIANTCAETRQLLQERAQNTP
jgi:glycosyltransferase involved in cell wall biosynthesis